MNTFYILSTDLRTECCGRMYQMYLWQKKKKINNSNNKNNFYLWNNYNASVTVLSLLLLLNRLILTTTYELVLLLLPLGQGSVCCPRVCTRKLHPDSLTRVWALKHPVHASSTVWLMITSVHFFFPLLLDKT